MAAHGDSRAATRGTSQITSIGTERSYQQSLAQLAGHLQSVRGGDLRSVNAEQARDWLRERACSVAQPTIDRDRQAVEAWLSARDGAAPGIERIQAAGERGLAEESRRYTADQVQAIASHQDPHNAVATEVAYQAGLRAEELGTIAPASERPQDLREWRDDLGAGRPDTVAYTVEGKGGLTREVHLPVDTAERLESYRRPEPVTHVDRGVEHESRYAIGCGQAWSQSYSAASDRALGWSEGAHGVRHSFAQDRLETLQREGYSYENAREVISQELGHMRADITEAYLR